MIFISSTNHAGLKNFKKFRGEGVSRLAGGAVTGEALGAGPPRPWVTCGTEGGGRAARGPAGTVLQHQVAEQRC